MRAQAQSIETWEAKARAAGMGDDQRAMLAKMFRWYAQAGLIGSPNVLRWLLGRPPTTLDAFAARAAVGER